MISPSSSFTIVPGSASRLTSSRRSSINQRGRFGLQELACVNYEDKPRPKTRSCVVSAISLNSVPAKAQPNH